jgi:hypothetical protein
MSESYYHPNSLSWELTESFSNYVRYEQYYEWFRMMFPVNASIPVYYMPGNNDVG